MTDESAMMQRIGSAADLGLATNGRKSRLTTPKSPQQLPLPGFRDRPFMGVQPPIRVARWVLRLLARTEARDAYLARNHSPSAGIDQLLGIRADQRPDHPSALSEMVIRQLAVR